MFSSGNLNDRPRTSPNISSATTPAWCPVKLAKHHRGPEMNCQRCGSQMPDVAAFCHNCGAPRASANPMPSTPPPPQGPYPPNPYLQAQYPQQGSSQGYALPPQSPLQQPQYQQNPYPPPQYPQAPYPTKPVQQQSTAMRVVIIIVSILSILIGLLRIFRVFR